MKRFAIRHAGLAWAVSLLTAWAGLPAHGTAQQDGPPPPLDERPIEFPEFEEFTLENGLRVVVLSYGAQPVMSARLYVPGGRAADEPGTAGLAQLTATVLTRGTRNRTATEISEEIEGVGGSLTANAGQDFFSVSTVVLVDQSETAFELMGDVVLNATFPDEEVELARRQFLSSLQAELGQPQTIASRRFSALVHGPEHPYGLAPTPPTVQAVGRDELIAYRDERLVPGGALLVVAGRVDRDLVEDQVRRTFAQWTGGPAPAPARLAAAGSDETRIHLVHRPGSVQSVVVMGHLGVEPDNPDYFPLQVLNRVLGGGADARLFRILREERGWTYGAFSQFTRPAGRGHFLAQAEVRPEVTDSTVIELLNQVERLRNETVPDDELDGARSFLAGSFPLRLETADQVAGQIATTILLELPLEDVTEYPERIRAVDAEELRRVAVEYLHPDAMTIVVVGDAGILGERLEAVGPVDYLDVDGSPLSREEALGTPAPALLGRHVAGRRNPPLRGLSGGRLDGLRRVSARTRRQRLGIDHQRHGTRDVPGVTTSVLRLRPDAAVHDPGSRPGEPPDQGRHPGRRRPYCR
jgi:zinc protease